MSLEAAVLSILQLCVCVSLCVYVGENRTVTAVSVSGRKVQKGEEGEKRADRKSQDQAVPVTEHSIGSSGDTAVHRGKARKE